MVLLMLYRRFRLAGRRTGGRSPAAAPAAAAAPARAAVAAVQVADFPRRPVRRRSPVCSARSRPCPLLCGHGDAGASLVGWHFVVVGPACHRAAFARARFVVSVFRKSLASRVEPVTNSTDGPTLSCARSGARACTGLAV